MTGKRDGFETALALPRPRGTVVLKSTFHGALAWTPWPVIVDEIRLIGSRCGPFAPAIALLAAKRIDVAPLLAAVRPLEFEAASETLKVIL